MDDTYWVVEARYPVQISDAISAEEAARKAARRIESELGININNWFFRIFEYKNGEMKEYFSNPSGSEFRLIDKNIDIHAQKIEDEKVSEHSS